MTSANVLYTTFKQCLDILRNDSEHLVGEEALIELSYFLLWKQADLLLVPSQSHAYSMSTFLSFYSEDLLTCFQDMLVNHPTFQELWQDQSILSKIKDARTIEKILLALDVDPSFYHDFDVLGEAYELIFMNTVFGAGNSQKNELAQFFTPPRMKQLLIQLVNPVVDPITGRIETILDPSCGTGGLLKDIIKHYQKITSSFLSREELNQQFQENIYGIEIKSKIFHMCMCNMIVHTGTYLKNVKQGDSLRTIHHDLKVDIIVANPPFSICIPYKPLQAVTRELQDYIPIPVGGKNSEFLFLQMMIYCLKINGRCATVMLDGQKLFGTSSGYHTVREYLMRTCDLQEIIQCPSGLFTSTSSKTCILFFIKKKEANEVILSSKPTLQWKDDSFATQTVKCFTYDLHTHEKKWMTDLSIDLLQQHQFSLNPHEYSKDFLSEEIIPSSHHHPVYRFPSLDVPLRELCHLIIGGTPRRNHSEYYQGGRHPWVSVKELNYQIITDTKEHLTDLGLSHSNVKKIPCNTILYSFKLSIGKIAISGKELYTNEAIAALLVKDEQRIKMKYLFYVLLSISLESLLKSSKGCIGNGSLNKKSLGDLPISIVPLEKQIIVVERMDQFFVNATMIQQHRDVIPTMMYLLLTEQYALYESYIITLQFNLPIDHSALSTLEYVKDDLNSLKEIHTRIYHTILSSAL